MQNSKVVIKTAEMLAQFDEQETANIISSTIAFAEGEDSAEEAIATFSRIIGLKPSFARYEMGRIIFVETLEGQGLSQDAIYQRSLRFFRKLGIDKPTSDNPEAIRKAKEREESKAKKRDAFVALSNEELQAKVKSLLASPTLANLKSSQSIAKELENRQKEVSKESETEFKELQKEVLDHIKTLSFDELSDLASQIGIR
jgi:hypothetical protein